LFLHLTSSDPCIQFTGIHSSYVTYPSSLLWLTFIFEYLYGGLVKDLHTQQYCRVGLVVPKFFVPGFIIIDLCSVHGSCCFVQTFYFCTFLPFQSGNCKLIRKIEQFSYLFSNLFLLLLQLGGKKKSSSHENIMNAVFVFFVLIIRFPVTKGLLIQFSQELSKVWLIIVSVVVWAPIVLFINISKVLDFVTFYSY